MANVELKKDFKDGQFLYGDDLNNNFKVIEAGVNSNLNELSNYIFAASEELKKDLIDITSQRGWDWENSNGERVTFYKGNTDQINNYISHPGQLLYNTETGETYLYDNGKLILTGSGNILKVSEEEPTNPGTKVWIKPNELQKVDSTEVINSLEGNETNLAPSVRAVKKAIEKVDAKNNYSTEEQVIGKWIDGKPLYRKTIDCGNLPNNTEISIQHNCENADFCNMYGIIKGVGQHWPLNMFQTSNVANGVQIAIAAGTINIKTTTDKRNFKAYITLEYTKTTD